VPGQGFTSACPAAGTGAPSVVRVIPRTQGDTMRNRMISLVALAAVLAFATTALASSGTRIALKGSTAYPSASGHATSRAGKSLEVEVQHVRSLAGKRVSVFV